MALDDNVGSDGHDRGGGVHSPSTPNESVPNRNSAIANETHNPLLPARFFQTKIIRIQICTHII